MQTIGVIGTGFVGTAVIEGMRHAFNVIGWDKTKGWTHADKNDIRYNVLTNINPEISIGHIVSRVDGPIFVCVPTPMNPDGSCNISIVEQVIKEIAESVSLKVKDGPVVAVIKSTVVPGTTLRLNQQYDKIHVCFNPEFLTERNFIEDFKKQDRIIIGGPHDGTAVLKQMYETAYPAVPVTKTSSTIAEMVKYMTNCFLATKVSFANEMRQLCDKLEVDYDKVVEYATKDKRLGASHWSVPGPDGKKGWGGKCFGKDINALIALAKIIGVDPIVMEAAWESNVKVRPEKDWENIEGVITKNE